MYFLPARWSLCAEIVLEAGGALPAQAEANERAVAPVPQQLS